MNSRAHSTIHCPSYRLRGCLKNSCRATLRPQTIKGKFSQWYTMMIQIKELTPASIVRLRRFSEVCFRIFIKEGADFSRMSKAQDLEPLLLDILREVHENMFAKHIQFASYTTSLVILCIVEAASCEWNGNNCIIPVSDGHAFAYLFINGFCAVRQYEERIRSWNLIVLLI